MEPITKTKKLAEACDRLSRHPFVTVDTEFQRESTYYPILCVAQLASPEEAIIVDALAEGIDLGPFFTLMADPKVVKVFHAARQDIEICWHAAGIIPTPLVDTQVAAMVLGYGDFDLVRSTGRAHHRRQSRQVAPLHRLDAAAALAGAADLCGLRRDPSARRLSQARRPTSTSSGRAEWMREEMKVLTSRRDLPRWTRNSPGNA